MSPSRWAGWILAYACCVVVAWALAAFTRYGGDIAFIAGGLVILLSVGFIGFGGERRLKIRRNIMGVPIGKDPIDPARRSAQIATGIRVFLLGLALWLPLLVLAWR